MANSPQQLGAVNGRLPDWMLKPVGRGQRLYPTAADAWNQLVADAQRDGVTITITDSYRDYARQVDLARRKGLYSEGGLAATPGTSNHGWGLAVDANIDDRAAAGWLAMNAASYGFAADVPREPWHFDYLPMTSSKAAGSTPTAKQASTAGDLWDIAVHAAGGLLGGGITSSVASAAPTAYHFFTGGWQADVQKLLILGIGLAGGIALIVIGASTAVKPIINDQAATIAPIAAAAGA